jgi:hypothetical protein
MANTKKRVRPRKPPQPPRLVTVTHRIIVEITEGQPPEVSWPGLDAYAVPAYLRKAALRVEQVLGIRE